jgi:hypothetical protein
MNSPDRSFDLSRLLPAAALLLALAACSTLQVGSDYDRGAHFSDFHNFALMERSHDRSDSAVRNPLVAQRVRDDIKSVLMERGFTYDPARADFVVDFTVGSRERTDIQTYPQPWAGGGWWGGGPGWWGGPYWGTGVSVQQYQEGTLSIDVFDAGTHRPVWHGWAKKPLSDSELNNSAQPLREAVASVLEKFPPLGATVGQQ